VVIQGDGGDACGACVAAARTSTGFAHWHHDAHRESTSDRLCPQRPGSASKPARSPACVSRSRWLRSRLRT